MIYKDIYKEGNLYIIKKEINGEMIEFGRFSDLDEAIEERDELEDYGWPYLKKDSEDKFVEKNIYKENDKFIVSKVILDTEIVYGIFDDFDEAKSLKRILVENCWSLTPLSSIIKIAKYIIKHGNKFIVRKKFGEKTVSFGSFDDLDEAIMYRDSLVDNNWGMTEEKILENIDLTELKGENKFIGKSGRSFIVYNFSNKKYTLYGYYSSLRSAIRARDKLIANGWDGEALGIEKSKERGDFNRHIQKFSEGYSVINRIDGELIVFGTFPTLSEALEYRDYLEENDWDIEDENDFEDEKYDEYIYLKSDGKYYLEKEVDGEMRIFGVFNDPLDAIAERLECMKNNWSSKSVYEKEYFNEDSDINLDYSSSLTNYQNNEDVFDDDSFYMSFRVTVGKSYKNKGWAVQRSSLEPFVPKVPYEKTCTLFIEGIEIKGKLNIHPRLFYFTNKELSNYLEKLAYIDSRTQARVDLELKHGNYYIADSDKDFITFKTNFSKSFKRGMFVMPREFSKEIMPILPYEKECVFSIGDIDASGRFNLEFRVRFDANSIVPQLTSLKDEDEELKVVFLLD